MRCRTLVGLILVAGFSAPVAVHSGDGSRATRRWATVDLSQPTLIAGTS